MTLTGVASGQSTSVPATGSSVSVADGTLSIVNGELQFVANHNVKVGNTDTFEYTIKDADGSTSTNTLTVTIGGRSGAGGRCCIVGAVSE